MGEELVDEKQQRQEKKRETEEEKGAGLARDPQDDAGGARAGSHVRSLLLGLMCFRAGKWGAQTKADGHEQWPSAGRPLGGTPWLCATLSSTGQSC